MAFLLLDFRFLIIFLALHLLFRIEILDDNHNLTAYPLTGLSNADLQSSDNHFAHNCSISVITFLCIRYVLVGGRFKRKNNNLGVLSHLSLLLQNPCVLYLLALPSP